MRQEHVAAAEQRVFPARADSPALVFWNTRPPAAPATRAVSNTEQAGVKRASVWGVSSVGGPDTE